MLPQTIIDQLKNGARFIYSKHRETTVLFSNIASFDTVTAVLEPAEVVALLNDVFSRFDQLTDDFGVYKVETIGDVYMVCSGVPLPRRSHAHVLCDLALAMRTAASEFRHHDKAEIEIRIGLNSGSVIAGVIGMKYPRYRLMGDTVNTASRMSTTCEPSRIQISQTTHHELRDAFVCQYRGIIPVKGKDHMETYYLLHRNPAYQSTLPVEQMDQKQHTAMDVTTTEVSAPPSHSADAPNAEDVDVSLETDEPLGDTDVRDLMKKQFFRTRAHANSQHSSIPSFERPSSLAAPSPHHHVVAIHSDHDTKSGSGQYPMLLHVRQPSIQPTIPPLSRSGSLQPSPRNEHPSSIPTPAASPARITRTSVASKSRISSQISTSITPPPPRSIPPPIIIPTSSTPSSPSSPQNVDSPSSVIHIPRWHEDIENTPRKHTRTRSRSVVGDVPVEPTVNGMVASTTSTQHRRHRSQFVSPIDVSQVNVTATSPSSIQTISPPATSTLSSPPINPIRKSSASTSSLHHAMTRIKKSSIFATTSPNIITTTTTTTARKHRRNNSDSVFDDALDDEMNDVTIEDINHHDDIDVEDDVDMTHIPPADMNDSIELGSEAVLHSGLDLISHDPHEMTFVTRASTKMFVYPNEVQEILNPYTLSFHTPLAKLEQIFRSDYFSRFRYPNRDYLLFVTIGFIMLGIYDSIVNEHDTTLLWQTWIYRSAGGIYGICMWRLSKSSSTYYRDYMQQLTSLFLIVLGVLAIQIQVSLSSVHLPYGFACIMLLLSLTSLSFGLRFVWVVLTTFCICTAYVLAVYLQISNLKTQAWVFLVVANLMYAHSAYSSELYVRRDFIRLRKREEEERRSSTLLDSMLPEMVMEEIRRDVPLIAHEFPHASVLFCDIVSFTKMASSVLPEDLVAILNVVFSTFDQLSTIHKIYKVETIGDAYMACSGIVHHHEDHTSHLCNFALEMQEKTRHFKAPKPYDQLIRTRIGIHTGYVIAGVVGKKMPRYHLFGETISIANQMESNGFPGHVCVSGVTRQSLPTSEYILEPRGVITIGNKQMERYLLAGRTGAPVSIHDSHPRDRSRGSTELAHNTATFTAISTSPSHAEQEHAHAHAHAHDDGHAKRISTSQPPISSSPHLLRPIVDGRHKGISFSTPNLTPYAQTRDSINSRGSASHTPQTTPIPLHIMPHTRSTPRSTDSTSTTSTVDTPTMITVTVNGIPPKRTQPSTFQLAPAAIPLPPTTVPSACPSPSPSPSPTTSPSCDENENVTIDSQHFQWVDTATTMNGTNGNGNGIHPSTSTSHSNGTTIIKKILEMSKEHSSNELEPEMQSPDSEHRAAV